MIDDVTYVKMLIRKAAKRQLTEMEEEEVRLARCLYGAKAWFRLEVDAFCELECAKSPSASVDWRPAFARVRQRERREILRRRTRRIAPWLGAAAMSLAVIWSVGRWAPAAPEPMELGSNCHAQQWAADGEIPGSEFACTVHVDDSTSMVVSPGSQGRIGAIRNLEIRRQPDGTLSLSRIGNGLPADTAGMPVILIATHPYQQCSIALPDGTQLRLNAGSVLRYSLANLGRDTTSVWLQGQALVESPGKKGAKPTVNLILWTPDVELQVVSGTFTVLAERYQTRAVLLEGRLTMFSRWGDKREDLDFAGESVRMKRCCVDPKGREVTTEVEHGCLTRKQALAWTQMMREYENVPVREFVADMSRWHGFEVKNMDCIPDGPLVNAKVCYQASVGDVYAQLSMANVPMVERNGLVSFCKADVDLLQFRAPLRTPYDMGLLAAAADGDDCCGLDTPAMK